MIDKDSVSFRDIIIEINSIIKYLFSKWLIIGIIAILGGIVGVVYSIIKKPKYSATLNFVLSSNSSSNNGIMGLASQFGVNLDNSDDIFSGDNIIALMTSRRMVQQALFSKPDKVNETLLNLFIKDQKMDGGWDQNDRTKDVYPFPDDPSKMSLIQDSLFRVIYNNIQGDMLDVSKPENNQSIYVVTTTSTNDTFSYWLTKYLVAATSTFYIATKTSTAKQNLNMLQKEADSLRNVLGGAITSAGSQTDFTFNLNPAYQVQRSGALQSQASATALGQAYGEVLRNLEIAKITLQKETPLYQIIDEPTLPLERQKIRKLYALIIGGFLAGLLACGYLVVAKILRSFKTA